MAWRNGASAIAHREIVTVSKFKFVFSESNQHHDGVWVAIVAKGLTKPQTGNQGAFIGVETQIQLSEVALHHKQSVGREGIGLVAVLAQRNNGTCMNSVSAWQYLVRILVEWPVGFGDVVGGRSEIKLAGVHDPASIEVGVRYTTAGLLFASW